MLEPQNLSSILEGKLFDEVCKVLRMKNLDTFETYCFPRKYKDKFECVVSTLKRFIDNSNAGERLEIDDALNREIGQLLASLVYLCNSTSFRTGTYQPYDRDEINRKLKR